MVNTRSNNDNTMAVEQQEIRSNKNTPRMTMAMLKEAEAPQITSIAQEDLVTWKKEWKVYEDTVKNTCRVSGDDYKKYILTIKEVFKDSLLKYCCKFIWKKDHRNITDDVIVEAIEKMVRTPVNGVIPPLDQVFAKLTMNLRIKDVRQRVASYFTLFDELVEKHGLQDYFESSESTKVKCEYLAKNLYPILLKTKVTDLMKLQPSLKRDETELHEVIVKEALNQQNAHNESKPPPTNTGYSAKRKHNHTQSDKRPHYRGQPKRQRRNEITPADGSTTDTPNDSTSGGSARRPGACWGCGSVSHRLYKCPQATTPQEREKIRKEYRQKKN
jgi:hypothetical protein